MSLATVIRLEFAYPGVGVLAGDSLQYLSVATAHGVIMVFYMIMPAIFGAFGNFLLPTQLGVHDVAFPRLNSAAFWFLPGGVIMLFQLVCTDRRYARMNCFNIRELQSILKDRFFVDLVTSHNHRDLISSTMLGVRYKSNSETNLELEINNFYSYGLLTSNLNKVESLTNNYSNSNLNKRSRPMLSFFDYKFLLFNNIFNFSSLTTIMGSSLPLKVKFYYYYLLLKNFFCTVFLSLLNSFKSSTIFYFFQKLPSIRSCCVYIFNLPLFVDIREKSVFYQKFESFLGHYFPSAKETLVE
jgi:hypothetical protein